MQLIRLLAGIDRECNKREPLQHITRYSFVFYGDERGRFDEKETSDEMRSSKSK